MSSALLIHYALVSGGLYRKQVYAVLLAIVLPWFGSVVSIFGDTAIEFTPLLLAGTGLTLSWAFFKGRLLDISPVAYREVVESLNSAVFVVDTDDTIIEPTTSAGNCLETKISSGNPSRTRSKRRQSYWKSTAA